MAVIRPSDERVLAGVRIRIKLCGIPEKDKRVRLQHVAVDRIFRMRAIVVIGFAAGVLAISGCVAPAELQESRQAKAASKLARALEGRVAGEAQTCIANHGVTGPEIIDERTMLYQDGPRVWRADLPEDCPGMTDDDFLVVRLFGSQICRNDQFFAQRRGSNFPGPSCRFGTFTPYIKPRV